MGGKVKGTQGRWSNKAPPKVGRRYPPVLGEVLGVYLAEASWNRGVASGFVSGNRSLSPLGWGVASTQTEKAIHQIGSSAG